MAARVLGFTIVLVVVGVSSKTALSCSILERAGNAGRLVKGGTIQREGEYVVSWDGACGSRIARISDGGSIITIVFSQIFSSSCINVSVLDSGKQVGLGVVNMCPPRLNLPTENFHGRELELRQSANGSVSFSLTVHRIQDLSIANAHLLTPSPAMPTHHHVFPVVATDHPQYLNISSRSSGSNRWIISSGDSNSRAYVTVLQADSSNCAKTWISVYDGGLSKDEDLLGKFCNTKPSFLSSGPALAVVLHHTDTSEPSGRFVLSFAKVHANSTQVPCNTTLHVGRRPLNLSSPGFSEARPHQTDCWWLLSAAPGSRRRLVVHGQLLSLRTRDPAACRDWLKIHDGEDSGSALLLDEVCGIRGFTRASSSGSLLLWFHSRDNETAPGFRLLLWAEDSKESPFCSSSLPGGVHEMELGEGQYEIRLQPPPCTLQLTAKSGNHVRLQAPPAFLRGESSCRNIVIHDGPTTRRPVLIRWCGDALLDVESTGAFMLIQHRQLPEPLLLYASSSPADTLSNSQDGGGEVSNLPQVIVSVLVVAVFIALCGVCCVGCCRLCKRRRRRRRQQRQSAMAREVGELEEVSGQQHPASSFGRIPTVSERVVERFSEPPPPYEVVVAPPPPYSAAAESAAAQELPPISQADKPPAYSDVGLEVEA